MRKFQILWLLALAVIFWDGPPVRAAESLFEVDARVEIALTEPGKIQEFPVRVLRPGLLAVETDRETSRKLKVEVQDPAGRVLGLGGARIAQAGEYLVRVGENNVIFLLAPEPIPAAGQLVDLLLNRARRNTAFGVA